jgi:acetyltransferase-like isoleucine patch superfamily enzyme
MAERESWREYELMLIPKERIPIREIILYGLLPSFLKKFVYRLKGYRFGKGVHLGFGSVICADSAQVGEYSSTGFFTIMRGREIKIGSHVSIGSTTFIDTPYVEIGDGSKINEQVFVGGLQLPDSKFVLGRNCQIMQMSFINPAVSITIGDDTGIGGHCLIFGHTSWLSQFEGYPVEFSPIEIGKSVSLAWRVFVLPGTKIGDGATIGANSLVHRTIPERCLAVGFPARVVSKYPEFPKEVSEEEKVDILKNIVSEMIDSFQKSGLSCKGNGSEFEITKMRRGFLGSKERTWRLKVEYDKRLEEDSPKDADAQDVLLSLREIPKAVRAGMNAKRIMWIDIERKEQPLFWNDLGEEVALYLKRYGVRLFKVKE